MGSVLACTVLILSFARLAHVLQASLACLLATLISYHVDVDPQQPNLATDLVMGTVIGSTIVGSNNTVPSAPSSCGTSNCTWAQYSSLGVGTPSRRIRLKACVDLGDQTAEFIPFEVISTAILTYFYLLLGIYVRILVSVINTRFQPDAPRRCTQYKNISSFVRYICKNHTLISFTDGSSTDYGCGYTLNGTMFTGTYLNTYWVEELSHSPCKP